MVFGGKKFIQFILNSHIMKLNHIVLIIILLCIIFISGCVDIEPRSYESDLNNNDREINEIVTILKDFGLNNQDIINVIKHELGYSDYLIKKEDPRDYITAYYDDAYNRDFSEIISNKYWVAHDILKLSKIGINSDISYDDETALMYINNNLKIHGLTANFSPHDWDEKFQISIGNETRNFSADFNYSTDYHDMRKLINTINLLLRNFDLIYLDADSGGDDYTFLLLEVNRYEQLRNKYKHELNKILTPFKFR